jgi:hypothetical protein
MELDISSVITSGISLVAGVVWLVRLEGRINLESELRMALENRLNGFESRISATLDRIEQKLDAKVDK